MRSPAPRSTFPASSTAPRTWWHQPASTGRRPSAWGKPAWPASSTSSSACWWRSPTARRRFLHRSLPHCASASSRVEFCSRFAWWAPTCARDRRPPRRSHREKHLEGKRRKMNVRMIVGILAALLLAVSTARGQGPSAALPAKSSPVSGAPKTPVKKAPSAPKVDDDEDRNDDEDTPQSRAEEKKEQENDLYDEGSEALDDGHFDRAAELFGECAALGGEKADGAMYWYAYAQNKLGHRDEALKKLAELQKAHPASRWVKEAKALEVEVHQAGGQPIAPESENDE